MRHTYGELYRDYLDELYDVEPYRWSECLEAVDPTAFQIGFYEYTGNFDTFACCECSGPLADDDTDDVEMDNEPLCRRCLETEGMDGDEITAYDREHAVKAQGVSHAAQDKPRP